MKRLFRFFIVFLLVTFHSMFFGTANGAEIQPVFLDLFDRLCTDGIDRDYLKWLFTHPELKLMPKAIARGLAIKEVNLNYSQFLERKSIDRAVSYLQTHNQILRDTESNFGVSAPVVVAILSVETACGTYTGHVDAVNILVTQALSLKTEVFRQIVDEIAANLQSNMPVEQIRKRLKIKGKRAYQELKALLFYLKNDGIEPFPLKSSLEGAIGLPQFLPSNIQKYGYDGDGDGKIDLFKHEDAIASIASYLKAFKWQEDSSYTMKKEVILNYNRSTYYATTVLKLADVLKEFQP